MTALRDAPVPLLHARTPEALEAQLDRAIEGLDAAEVIEALADRCDLSARVGLRAALTQIRRSLAAEGGAVNAEIDRRKEAKAWPARS